MASKMVSERNFLESLNYSAVKAGAHSGLFQSERIQKDLDGVKKLCTAKFVVIEYLTKHCVPFSIVL